VAGPRQAGRTREARDPLAAVLLSGLSLRIPTKSAGHSEAKSATCTDLMSAGWRLAGWAGDCRRYNQLSSSSGWRLAGMIA